MSNKEEPLSEEQEAELESVLKPVVKNTIDKIYTPLSWCWPATIVLLVVRWILGSYGYYDMPLELATVFLWGPVALVVGLTSFLILVFYMIALFASWHTFMQNSVFYLRLGFANGASKKDGVEKNHMFYTPERPEKETETEEKENDDEAL